MNDHTEVSQIVNIVIYVSQLILNSINTSSRHICPYATCLSKWNLPLLDSLLVNYHDKEITQFLCYGFPINFYGPEPQTCKAKKSQRSSWDTDSIGYHEWQRVDVEFKGKTTKKTKFIQVKKSKVEFIDIMRESLQKFHQHADHVRIQYEEIRKLKTILPDNHVISRMDFAENYLCATTDEVEAACMIFQYMTTILMSDIQCML